MLTPNTDALNRIHILITWSCYLTILPDPSNGEDQEDQEGSSCSSRVPTCSSRVVIDIDLTARSGCWYLLSSDCHMAVSPVERNILIKLFYFYEAYDKAY